MKGSRIRYSDDEMAWLQANRLMVISDYHREFCAAFDRDDVSAQNLNCLRQRKGWKTGRTGRFEKGSEPANKGKPCPPGKGGRHPNARRTQFKKGQLPHNTKYLGHERISKDGYLEISVDERNPHTGFERRYVLKHKWLWEKQNGPVPEGHALKCLDGDRTNCDPSNWAPVPRNILPALGARSRLPYDQAHPDVRPAIMTIAKLRHAARKAKRARA
ncbi:HNH endonuclease [Hyphomicrobium sp. DY-1]|uniref:HNH endonuclease n=1 Tax=Hyphomicrobium sp. DY-1 TaxID=3075650 RepID=UPI0039C00711